MAREGTSTKQLSPFSVEDPSGQGVKNTAEARLLRKIHESDGRKRGRSQGLAPGSSGVLAQASASSSVAQAYAAGRRKERPWATWLSYLLLFLVALYAFVDWAIPQLWGALDSNL